MSDEFSPKDPAEIVPLSFDFANLTATPVNPVVTVSYVSGPKDGPDYSGMLAGTPQVIGTEVRQKLQAGTAGTTYKVRCQADSGDGLRFVIARNISVETA